MTTPDQSARRAVLARTLLPRLVLNIVVPFAVYLVLRPYVPNDMIALLAGIVIPVAVTIVGFVVRRRFDPIGLVSIALFAVLILLLLITGGNPLILKLHEAVFTGPVGVIAIASALIGWPLLGLVPSLRRTLRKRQLTMLTLIIGAILVVHCAVVLGLALALPTATFLAVGRLAGIAVIVLGVLCLIAYRRRVSAAR